MTGDKGLDVAAQRGFVETGLEILMVVVLGFVGLLGGLALIGHLYGQYQCANYQKITGKETRYAPFDICYIKTADGWQRWDEYKKRAVASEGLREVGK